MKTPRDYQENAIQAPFDFFKAKSGNPLIVAPVGAGKSFIMAEFMRRACAMYPDTRFIVLAHVAKLLQQNAQELLGQWPEASISFYSDKLGQKKLDGQIIFASIQSIYRKALHIRGTIDMILVDECHLISPDNTTMYRQFLSELKLNNPYVKVVGYTGTPFRPGKGYLHEGENALFSDIAYEIEMNLLIEQGFLCPIFTPKMRTQMDISGVKQQGGDFILSQLAKAVDKEEITEACVEEIVEHGINREKWLIFATDIRHADHIRDAIRRRGFTCEAIHSKLPNAEQADILCRYERDEIRCVVNVAQMTTGINIPAIDLLAFMRPTRSIVLYIQCCGRAMRTFPGKLDALVLDFGGVVDALGPIDRISVTRKRKGGGGPAPVRTCPACQTKNPTSVRHCRECGHEFPPPAVNLAPGASDAAVLSTQRVEPKSIPVTRVLYFRHTKPGKPDSLRVEYLCGLSRHVEWVLLEHSRQAREDAALWWSRRMPGTRTPNTIAEALELAPSLPIPAAIRVKKNGKFTEVVGHDFDPIVKAG
jgi:DNA repair protein RadD